jgi:GTP-binding protein EngB required for normal cell division
MMKVNIKKNTLFLCGQSNAGKSVVLHSLLDRFCEFGVMTKSDTFGFQDTVDRQVIVNEKMLMILRVLTGLSNWRKEVL